MTINETLLTFWINYPLGAIVALLFASGFATKGLEVISNWKNNKKKADVSVASAAMQLVGDLQEELEKMRDERRRFKLENDEIVKTSDKLKHAVELCLETLEEKGADTLEIDRIRALGG